MDDDDDEEGELDRTGWRQAVHSVALREKESLGLDLPFPRMIFCSSFCCL